MSLLRMLGAVIVLAIAGCASAVGPTDAGSDVDATAPAVDAGDPVACVNSSTCPTQLACLQGHCQTPCQAYDAGCD